MRVKAVVRLEVPDYQIGQEVSVYFKDTMMLKGVCEAVRRWEPYRYAIPLTEDEVPMGKGGFRHIDGEAKTDG